MDQAPAFGELDTDVVMDGSLQSVTGSPWIL